MIQYLKRFVGIFVGYFVVKSQFIPIGKSSPLRSLNARWGYSQADIKELERLWPEFNRRNQRYKRQMPSNYVHVKRELLTTEDGSKLDTVEFSPHAEHAKKYIIYGWGRNNHYELYLHRLAEDAMNMKRKIITFNYRGVGSSEGTLASEHDLVNDYLFQINRLLKKGIKPENIQCYGHSLGGAIATSAVHQLWQKGIHLKIFNDRSFGNLVDTSVALFFKRPSRRRRLVNLATMTLSTLVILPLMLWSSLSLVGLSFAWMLIAAATVSDLCHPLFNKTVGSLLENGLNFAMRFSEWVLDVAKKYDEIPYKQKSHMIIHMPKGDPKNSKTLGKRNINMPSQDRIIFYQDSLHHHATRYRDKLNALKKEIRRDTAKGKDTTQKRAELLNLSHVKVTGGDHSDHPDKLLTWYPGPHRRHLTGQQRIYHFFDETGAHIAAMPKRYKIH